MQKSGCCRWWISGEEMIGYYMIWRRTQRLVIPPTDLLLRCRYIIRFARAEPCDCPVHRPIVTCGVLVECSAPMKIGWLGIRARSILQPILSHLLCDYPIRAQWPFKSTFTPFNHDGEDGLRAWMHRKAPMLLRVICVSCNMEFFCRTNIKRRNALPVTLDCSQYDGSRFKKYRRCHGLCV